MPTSSAASHANLAFLIFTLVTSFLFGTWLNPPAPFTKKDLLRGLAAATETATIRNEQKHLVIGFNTNLDTVVANGPSFLRKLGGVDEYAAAADFKIINSPEDFAKVFAHHFSTASAGERAIVNETLWNEIVMLLEASNEMEDSKLGGNAAIMAEAVARNFPNVDVSLIGMIGVKIAGKLHSRIKPVSFKEGTIKIQNQEFPAKHDQIHLILEYPGDSKFGSHKAHRANRFIVSRDFSNGAFASLDAAKEISGKKN